MQIYEELKKCIQYWRPIITNEVNDEEMNDATVCSRSKEENVFTSSRKKGIMDRCIKMPQSLPPSKMLVYLAMIEYHAVD